MTFKFEKQRFTLICFLFILLIINSSLVIAVDFPNVTQRRPSDSTLELVPKEIEPPRISLPAISPDDTLNISIRIHSKEFAFLGNTVFSDAELLAVVSDYLDRDITSNDFLVIRNLITQHYIDNGYINSGVVLPDQKIENGKILFQIIEGELSAIQLSGQDNLHYNYIYQRILLGSKSPLNINALQKQLFLLQQDSRIKRVNARLQPGGVLGKSILYLDIEEDKLGRMTLRANNYSTPTVGEYRVEMNYEHLSALGFGDTLNVRYAYTDGLYNTGLTYDFPLSTKEIRVGGYYNNSESEIITRQFVTLGFRNSTKTWGVDAVFPVIINVDGRLDLGAKLENRTTQSSTIIEIPPEFKDIGVGESRIRVLRLLQSGYKRYQTRVISGRSTISKGTSDSDDGNFTSWLTQLQWLERFSNSRSEVLFRVNAQFSNGPLLSLEQFSIGGVNSVRGYRENVAVGDGGVNYSIEYRYLAHSVSSNVLQVMVFSDYGRVENKEDINNTRRRIYSIGTGFRWNNDSGSKFELFWAKSMQETVQGDIQENRVHFQLSVDAF